MKVLFKQAGVFVAGYAATWLVATLVVGVVFAGVPQFTFMPILKSVIVWAGFYGACVATNRYRQALADRAEISPVAVPGFAVYKACALIYAGVLVASLVVFRHYPYVIMDPWTNLLEVGASFSLAHAIKYAQLELTRPRRVFYKR